MNADALREEFAFWLTTRCDFNFILAEKLRNATPSELPKMPSLQQLRRDKPDWVVRKPISLQGALAGEYVTKYLSLSYRCERGTSGRVWGAAPRAAGAFETARTVQD